VTGVPDEDTYRKVVGDDRLARLGTWSQSSAAWKELFA
jgi:hypothetical protein